MPQDIARYMILFGFHRSYLGFYGNGVGDCVFGDEHRGAAAACSVRLGPQFWFLPSQLCQTLGDGFFSLAISFWELTNYNKWQTKNAKLLEML